VMLYELQQGNISMNYGNGWDEWRWSFSW